MTQASPRWERSLRWLQQHRPAQAMEAERQIRDMLALQITLARREHEAWYRPPDPLPRSQQPEQERAERRRAWHGRRRVELFEQASRLRRLRMRLGTTNEGLAQRLRIKATTFVNYVNGAARLPSKIKARVRWLERDLVKPKRRAKRKSLKPLSEQAKLRQIMREDAEKQAEVRARQESAEDREPKPKPQFHLNDYSGFPDLRDARVEGTLADLIAEFEVFGKDADDYWFWGSDHERGWRMRAARAKAIWRKRKERLRLARAGG